MTIPANTTATVVLPTPDANGITESGHPLAQAEGVKIERALADRTMLAIGSGRYSFVTKTK